jgi:phosphocarrier protein HPr
MDKPNAASASGDQHLSKELVVQNKMGIHARPAAMIVRITNKFKAEVFVEKDEEQVNGKSIMGLMMLAAGRGSKVKFLANGDDAGAMLAELDALFARKFDEA